MTSFQILFVRFALNSAKPTAQWMCSAFFIHSKIWFKGFSREDDLFGTHGPFLVELRSLALARSQEWLIIHWDTVLKLWSAVLHKRGTVSRGCLQGASVYATSGYGSSVTTASVTSLDSSSHTSLVCFIHYFSRDSGYSHRYFLFK